MNSDEMVYTIKYGTPKVRLLEHSKYTNTCTVCGVRVDIDEPRYLVEANNLLWVVCQYCMVYANSSVATSSSRSIVDIKAKEDMKKVIEDFKKRLGL